GIGVARHEYLLDAQHFRLVVTDQLAKAVENLFQAIGKRAIAKADATGRDVFAAVAAFADDAETGNPRTGVNAENQGHLLGLPGGDMKKGGNASLSSSRSPCSLHLRQHVVRDLGIGVDVLHVVQVLQHVDQPNDLLRSVQIQRRGGSGDHTYFRCLAGETGTVQGIFYRTELLEGGEYVEGAVIVADNVLGARFHGRFHLVILIDTR